MGSKIQIKKNVPVESLYAKIIGACETNGTLQPLYNTVLDITRFKDGSQKCIDYIEK